MIWLAIAVALGAYGLRRGYLSVMERAEQVEAFRRVIFDRSRGPVFAAVNGSDAQHRIEAMFQSWRATAVLPLPTRLRLRRQSQRLGDCHFGMIVEREYQVAFVRALIPDGSYRRLVARSARSVRTQATGVFGFLSAFLPARLVNEELGDALEDIDARISAGRPFGEIKLKIYASVFWALWHTALYAVKGVTDALGRKGG